MGMEEESKNEEARGTEKKKKSPELLHERRKRQKPMNYGWGEKCKIAGV